MKEINEQIWFIYQNDIVIKMDGINRRLIELCMLQGEKKRETAVSDIHPSFTLEERSTLETSDFTDFRRWLR